MSKTGVRDLAILGGHPLFSESLYVNRPSVGDRKEFMARVEAMLDRRWFTNHGPLVAELEDRLASFLRVKHCVLTCNGTVALQLANRALDLSGEVIIPSFTFVATAHALLWQGIEPVFCDIDPGSWNLDPARCEELITERTSAVIGVHLWGRPCDVQSLLEVASRHGLRLLFDAAHAFGCTHRKAMIGRFGDAEIFSFHATKVFHTFEGGAVATDDDDLAGQVRLMRNFGFTGYDEVMALGTNAKMPEACAAMGLANLEHLERLFEVNRHNYAIYREELGGLRGLQLLQYDERERHNHQYVVLEVEEDELGLSRDDLVRILHAENVLARRYFYPGCHRLEPYASRSPEVDGRLPNTNRIAQRVLVLPTGTGVSPQQVHQICTLLRLLADEAAAIQTTLESQGGLQSSPKALPVGRRTPGSRRGSRPAIPKLEIRIPISPNEKSLRMLRYLLESIQEFGGPIGRSAHCVVSVGADEPPRDLWREVESMAHLSLDFQWVNRELFRRRSYNATGLHRFGVESDADVVALMDVDTFVAGDFDRIIMQAHREQRFLGFIAHISPFDVPELRHIPSHRWWNWIFQDAGLPRPRLEYEHTGWGLMTKDVRHRRCPAYFNYGFVLAPRAFTERMAESYEAELDAVDRVVESWAKAQIACSLALARQGISCATLPIKYNFPLHVPAEAIRALNPDPDGEDTDDAVRIFHYLGDGDVNREHFATRETVEQVLKKNQISPTAHMLRRKLQIVHDRIMASSTRVST